MCRSTRSGLLESLAQHARKPSASVRAGQDTKRVDLLLSLPTRMRLARPGAIAEAPHCFVDRAVSRLTDTPLWRFEAMSLARYGDLRVGPTHEEQPWRFALFGVPSRLTPTSRI
jgi:hypothetical protein